MTSGQITYDLRRLRIHGLIQRIPHSFRYQVTLAGLRQARFLTRLTRRLLIPGLSQLTDPSPPVPTRLRAAARAYDAAIDELTRQAMFAALPCPRISATSRNDPPSPNLTHQEHDHQVKPPSESAGRRTRQHSLDFDARCALPGMRMGVRTWPADVGSAWLRETVH